jgi:hypothetical protein
VILYRKTPQLRIRRSVAPAPPYWAATTIAPYASRRAVPVAVDYLDLRATAAEKLDVSVANSIELPPRIEPPVLIEATGNAEEVFRRGEVIASQVRDPLLLASSAPTACEGTVVIAAWPRFDEAVFAAASRFNWGVAIPIAYPATTGIEMLNALAAAAARHGAKFLAPFAIELDATAKQALAIDDETYERLFHADLDPIHTATERHVAALAHEHGMADFLLPPRFGERSNWNAAIVLTLTASRMIAMEHELELAGALARSARVVAELDKPIARVAEAASLSIVEALDEVSVEVLTEWIETGRSGFVDRVDGMWRVRRDHGVVK